MTIAFAVIQGRVTKTVREDTYVPLHEREDNEDIMVNFIHEQITEHKIKDLLNDPEFEMSDDETRIEMATDVFEELMDKGYIEEYLIHDGIYVAYTDILGHHKTVRIKELSPEEKEVGNTWLTQG